MLDIDISGLVNNIKILQNSTIPGSPEYLAYENSINEIEKVIGEDLVVNYKYEIEFMRSGSLIGTLSGTNTSGGGGGGTSNPPVNTSLPAINDTTPTVGQTLSCTNGTWTNLPTSYSYVWKVNGAQVGTSSTYVVTPSDYNLPITVTVSATNSSNTTSATSSATSNVLPLPPTVVSNPVISGLTTSNSTLTCSTGVWSSQSSITYTYQWVKDGTNIPGEINNTYNTQLVDENHTFRCDVIATNSGGSSTKAQSGSVYITSPSVSTITSNNVYAGSDKLLIYTPPGYTTSLNNYPIIFFGHGDGERGVATDASYSVGSGNGVKTSWAGNISNTNKIIHSSVTVTVNGVQVATGRSGIISGSGVSGTYSFDTTTSASFSLVFAVAPANGLAIVINYTRSNLLSQGPFRYLNLGDEPNCIYVGLQISRASGGYTYADYTAAKAFIVAHNYRVNWNRVGMTGLSLGSGLPFIVWTTDPTQLSAFVMAPGGEGLPGGSSTAWSSFANKGKLFIQGSADASGNGFAAPAGMANNNGIDRPMPSESIFYWGLGHNSGLWDTKCYNRKNRTDAAGTADIDYIDDFLLKFSSDVVEQAGLFVDYAESTRVHEDYRKAKQQVDALPASGTKTTLLADLAALKTSIKAVTIIDFGAAFRATTGNINNVTSPATGTIASPVNLKNDEGVSTGYSLTLTAATDAVPSMIDDIGTNRLNGRAHGFEPYTNRDGMRVDAAGTTGQITISGLNNSKTYMLKIYAGASNNSFAARAEMEATFGGVTKYLYVDLNNVLYIKFTGLAPSSNQIVGTIKQRLTGNTERLFYLQAIEFIEE